MVVRGGMKLGLAAARGGAPTDKDPAIARYGDLVGKLDLCPASCRRWISGLCYCRRRRLQESAEPEAAAVAVSLLCPMCLHVNRALNNAVRLGSPAHGGREARTSGRFCRREHSQRYRPPRSGAQRQHPSRIVRPAARSAAHHAVREAWRPRASLLLFHFDGTMGWPMHTSQHIWGPQPGL
jgi:hypothetical protein